MAAVVRISLRWLLAILGCAASFAFGAGQWTNGIEDRLDRHCDSIYVSVEKSIALEQRTAELQAVYYVLTDRVQVLEARVDSLTSTGLEIQKDIYRAITGQEWGE